MARSETVSTIDRGVMGVGEGSVCASVQNMGVGERGVRLISRVGLFVNSYFRFSCRWIPLHFYAAYVYLKIYVARQG